MTNKNKLLNSTDPAPVYIENEAGTSHCLIICDHASNVIPKKLNNLGLNNDYLDHHIAIDIGTKIIGRYLSKKLNAPLIMAGYSRLVLDLNRAPDHPDFIPEFSDNISIPSNQNLSQDEKKQRIDEIYTPYHDVIEKKTQEFLAKGDIRLIISVHSFTPEMDGFKRPWHIGILWNKKCTLSEPLIQNLRKNNPDLIIGDNEPYSIKEDSVFNNTVHTHATLNNFPSIIPEFRQDMVDTPEKAEKMAEILLESIKELIK